MEKKKKLSYGLLTATGALVAGIVVGSASGEVAERYYDQDYVHNLTQTKYEQKIEQAYNSLEYQLSVHRALGVVPEQITLQKAQEVLATEVGPKYIEEATAEAEESRKRTVDQWRFTTGLLAGVACLLATSSGVGRRKDEENQNGLQAVF